MYLIYTKLPLQSIVESMTFSANSYGTNLLAIFVYFLPSKFAIVVLVLCSLNHYGFIVLFWLITFFSQRSCAVLMCLFFLLSFFLLIHLMLQRKV